MGFRQGSKRDQRKQVRFEMNQSPWENRLSPDRDAEYISKRVHYNPNELHHYNQAYHP